MRLCRGGTLLASVVLSLMCSHVEAQTVGTVKVFAYVDLVDRNSSYGIVILYIASLSAFFFTNGIRGIANLFQIGPDVQITLSFGGTLRWQFHELPVDLTIDPLLRCRPEFVGRFLGHSGGYGGHIHGVMAASLVMHSIVVHIAGKVACGTIGPDSSLIDFAFTEFKSGLFGRIYIIQGAGEYCRHTFVPKCKVYTC